MRKLGILVTGVALAAVSMTADAAIKLTATRTGLFYAGNAVVALPLNNAGATTLSFNLTANQNLLLSYSAMCSPDEIFGDGALGIDIEVNSVVVAPTVGTLDAFCQLNV